MGARAELRRVTNDAPRSTTAHRPADPATMTTPSDRSSAVLSMSAVALAYAAKVATQLGGERVALTEHAELRPIPPWTARRWVELPWLVRARIWLGPTRV